jgi:uncharacterized surface protein with fasciclin (FAS1) repeats
MKTILGTKKLFIAAVVATAALGAQAKDIVDTATGAGNFKTLVATVPGSDVMVSLTGGATVNNANVVAADVAADNGVIHAIDTVLMPK